MPKEKDSQTSSGEDKIPGWKKLFFAFSLLAVGGSIWYGMRRKKQTHSWEEADYEVIEDEPGPDNKPLPSNSKWKGEGFPLGFRSNGNRVILIQEALNRSFNAGLLTDGYWGDATQKAISAAHKQNPLIVPSAIVTQEMFGVLKSAFLKGTLPTGKSLSGPLGFTVEALVDTAIWNDEEFELIDTGSRIGRHLSTNNGITQVDVPGRGIMSVKTIDTVIR